MAKEIIAIGDNGNDLVSKLANNFDELYAGSGGGYVIATSDDINNTFWWEDKLTTYEVFIVVNDHDFGGIAVTLPAGVTLMFNGGVWSNGSITGNHTVFLCNGLRQCFDIDLVIDGTWLYDRFYPEYYGAKGDGATDDTNAITMAIAFTVGSELNIASGIYLVSTIEITNKLTITGRGNSSILYSTSALPIVHIHGSGSVGTTFNAIYVRGNLRADNGALRQSGFLIDNTGEVSLRKIRVTHCGDYGVRMNETGDTVSVDLLYDSFLFNVRGGIYGKRLSDTNIQLNAINISACFVGSNDGYGINISGTNIRIRDCRIDNNGDAGIMFTGTDMTESTGILNQIIDGCYFEGNAGGDIYCEIFKSIDPAILHIITALTIRNNYFATQASQRTKVGCDSAITFILAAGSEPIIDGVRAVSIYDNFVFKGADTKLINGNDIMYWDCFVRHNNGSETPIASLSDGMERVSLSEYTADGFSISRNPSIVDGAPILPSLETYADNAAAKAGGLVAGDTYRTSTGILMVVYD